MKYFQTAVLTALVVSMTAQLAHGEYGNGLPQLPRLPTLPGQVIQVPPVYPAPENIPLDPNQGERCRWDLDCGPGVRCVKAYGALSGVCR